MGREQVIFEQGVITFQKLLDEGADKAKMYYI